MCFLANCIQIDTKVIYWGLIKSHKSMVINGASSDGGNLLTQ